MIDTDLLSSKHHTQQPPVLPFFHRRQHAQWFVRSAGWHKDAARDNLLLHWLIEPHVFDLLLLSSNLIR